MANDKRESDTAKIAQKVKVKEITVVIEADASPTTPPSPTGNFCWCCRDGVVGWYPE